MRLRLRNQLALIAVCLGILMPVFAEQAPVYDADNLPVEFDGSLADQPSDSRSTPGEESAAYVPIQTPVRVNSSGSIPERISRIEQQMANLKSGQLPSRIESLQAEIQSLRGQVEQLTHQLQALQNQQVTRYADLDKRLSPKNAPEEDDKPVLHPPVPPPDLSSRHKPVTLKSTPKTSATPDLSQPNPAEEQKIYQSAYNHIKNKKYTDAINALEKMLKKYPSGQFASNAHYWLGELYGLLGQNDRALTEFETIVKRYPDGPRVSDAQLKIGLIYAVQMKWVEAKKQFKKVIQHYPGTASSRLASEQLKQINQAGH